MGRGMTLVWILVVLVVAALAYVRLAPSAPEQWHKLPDFTESRDGTGRAYRVVTPGPDGLARLAGAVADWPRTQILAGSVEQGRITWVSRTAVIGFPDYITAEQSGDTLRLYGRLRFGRSDFGVNAARLDAWVKKAGF